MKPSRPSCSLRVTGLLRCAVLLLAAVGTASGQISLPTAVNLALQNNPKVKLAQADLDHAKAVLSEAHDVFVPAVAASGGVGSATGAPLSPPVVFSVVAQSLVYNFSQPEYVRAAHAGVNAAQLALGVARTDVAEDVASTYLSLDNALERDRVLQQTLAIANRLVTIVDERFSAGVDPHIEVTKAHRTAAQMRLQLLLVEDEIATDTDHLAVLTGLPARGWTTDARSIPPLTLPAPPRESTQADLQLGSSAAFESARAKQFTARGESRFLLHPQLSFSAQYSKLSDAFTTYDFYYPGFRERIVCNPRCVDSGKQNSFNSLSIGVQLTLPLLDMVHRARAREAAIDAQRAFLDAEVQQIAFLEGRHKLAHSAEELAARAELATLDHDLAQDQLDAIAIRLRASAGSTGGEQMTPKDDQNARLSERQRQLDVLDAELQLHHAEISLLRQNGTLADWLAATIPARSTLPASGPAAPGANMEAAPGGLPAPEAPSGSTAPMLPPTVGTVPGTGASAPAAPSSPDVPATEGTLPASLPSAPVAQPVPSAPAPHA